MKAANTLFITICHLSPPRLPKIHDQESVTLRWCWFSGCGRVHVSIPVDHWGGQYIENKMWCTNVNIPPSTVAYLDATIYVKPETHNRRLELTGLAKPGETHVLTGLGLGLARQESVGQDFGWVWDRAVTFSRSNPRPLAGYPDPLLPLLEINERVQKTVGTVKL